LLAEWGKPFPSIHFNQTKLIQADYQLHCDHLPAKVSVTLTGYRMNKLRTDYGDTITDYENFWNQAKRHLRSFNGTPQAALSFLHQRVRMAVQLPTCCKLQQCIGSGVVQVKFKPFPMSAPYLKSNPDF